VSKRLEYKVLKVSCDDLETTLNIYAQDGYRAEHFFAPDDSGHLSLVLSRKQKSGKKHHEVFEDDDL
jgi:hypothetical protein